MKKLILIVVILSSMSFGGAEYSKKGCSETGVRLDYHPQGISYFKSHYFFMVHRSHKTHEFEIYVGHAIKKNPKGVSFPIKEKDSLLKALHQYLKWYKSLGGKDVVVSKELIGNFLGKRLTMEHKGGYSHLNIQGEKYHNTMWLFGERPVEKLLRFIGSSVEEIESCKLMRTNTMKLLDS